MIEEARRAHPAMTFSVGDFHALPFDDGSHGGLVAFYSIIHARPERLTDVARELARVIAPGGHALVAFHASGEVVHLDEWMGEPVDLDFHLFQTSEVQAALEGAGLTITARVERAGYPMERPIWRGYLLASRP